MDQSSEEQIRLHVAGATVRHTNPFSHLPSLVNEKELTQPFIEQWCVPYYMDLPANLEDQTQLDKYAAIKEHITEEVVWKLLGDFNWRTRQTGAYFAAIKGYSDMIDIIGVHLLKSEVCFAGKIYCLILAYFNQEKGMDYLNRYLEYYLQRKDLWFDQTNAMEAMHYLDQVNGSRNLEKHWAAWLDFLSNKPYWDRDIDTSQMENHLQAIRQISQANSQ